MLLYLFSKLIQVPKYFYLRFSFVLKSLKSTLKKRQSENLEGIY